MWQTFKEIARSVWEIILDYVRHRLFPVTVVFVVLFSILIHRLFVLQIVEGKEHLDNFVYKSEKTLMIDSVRGKILDCNGKVLAYNELSNAATFSNDPRMAVVAEEHDVSENEMKNLVLYDAISILERYGDTLTYDFPIELKKNGTYAFTTEGTKLKNFYKDVYAVLDYEELSIEQKSGGAEGVMAYLCDETFEIPKEYTKDMRLKICACRYKLWMNRYQQYLPVTIAYDISDESAAALTENSDVLPGIDVMTKSLRRYNDAKYFAHIIGYIGGISEEEMEEYNSKLTDDMKYNGAEMVGKMGIEQYCESDLRGSCGSQTMYVDNLGRVLEVIDEQPAKAGNNVYLTIDYDLQKYCYDMLEKEIAAIILANLAPGNVSAKEENAPIPITDAYFGLFNNNYISVEQMGDEDASALEKSIYDIVTKETESTLKRIEDILMREHVAVMYLDESYQEYMQYICDILSRNDILDLSKLDHESDEYLAYINDQDSLYDFLRYAINNEAIDIKALNASSDYYDNDELYKLLVDYALGYLRTDKAFAKMIVHTLIVDGNITGNDVVNLIYLQNVLPSDNDPEYAAFMGGELGAYEFMRRKLEKLDITPAMLDLKPCSGSVVITDVNTGDVKALVSYPGYDNNRLTNEVDSDYYNQLLEDKTTPMVNRATQVQTAPGSTFKVVSSVAGLTEGVIDPDTYINCSGEFTEIEPPPKCWIYPSAHGALPVAAAIQHSCNVFFYTVGYRLSMTEDGRFSDNYGLKRLNKYAEMFGLTELSGVEIDENKPQVSDMDSVRSAIGQGHNLYAPVQLSRYVTTVANRGTCYNLTLIDRVTDFEDKPVRENEAEVLHKLTGISSSTWNVVQEGMRNVVMLDTPETEMIYRIDTPAAGKSGTAQQNDVSPDHALFISYAPYEKPEVSVTSVIQYGYASGNTRELTGFIYAYMYDQQKLVGAEMKADQKAGTD